MSKSMFWLAKAALSGAVLLLFAVPAAAQEGASDERFEEVTVTARRREESLQDVPIAVSAFSGEYLDGIGAIDVTALTQSTPNITLEVSRATNTTLTAYIRGVGQQDPLAGFEGGVGLYLDDVYLARPQGTVFDLYDVERVEVLRGPQGTLYGRNTIGGAVKYVTRRLTDSPELDIRANFGAFSQADVLIKGALPVSDTFRIGGTVASFNREGYGTNLFTGEDNVDKEILGIRLSAEWEPSDAWFIRLFGDYTDDKSSPRHGHRLLPSTDGTYPVLPNVYDTRAGITALPGSNAGLVNNVDQGGVGLLIEWNLSDNWQIKSITSSREDNTESLIDFDNLPENTFDAPVIYENKQFSQEFQANYTSDRMAATLGLFYLDANAFNAFDVVLGGAGVTAFTLGDYDTNAWAVYGDFVFDLNDQWSLSVGGRYTEDERDATVTRETYLGGLSPYFGGADRDPLVGLTFNGNRTDSQFTPRASISWRPVDEHMLYVSYNEGFKGGGFDPRGAYQFPEVQEGFEPEEVDAYEFGVKSTWADGRLISNFALFYSDYKNVQVPGSILLDNDGDGVADGFAGTTTNAGKAEIQGAEFELIGNLTDNFSTTLALGWIDAEYTEWLVAAEDDDGNPIFEDISDQRVFQNTPEYTASLNLRYEWPVGLFGSDGDLALSTQFSYRDFTYQFEIPNPLTDQPAYTLVDASIAWNSASNRFSMALHGRNLTDKEYIVANYNFPTVENSVIGFYGPPRTWTITGTYRFF